MPPTQVRQVGPILKDLAACLINQMIADENPMPCVIGVIPGEGMTPEYQGPCVAYTTTNEDDEEVPALAEGCGRGWVRLGTAYPASGVGVPNTETGNCGSDLGVDINMGISRCYNPGAAREGPTAEYLEELFDRQMADMMSMKRAIQCCTTLEPKGYILNGYLPFGPLGTLMGGSWTLSLVR